MARQCLDNGSRLVRQLIGLHAMSVESSCALFAVSVIEDDVVHFTGDGGDTCRKFDLSHNRAVFKI